MRVEQRMSKTVWSCRIDDSMEHAARQLWEHDCGSLPVVGDHGQLHGMVTDRDICMAAYTTGRRLVDLQVREAMAIDVASVRPDTPLREAELMMRTHGVHRLPVLDDRDRVIGVLSSNDLVRWVDGGGTTSAPDHDAAHLVRTLATINRPRCTASSASPTPGPETPSKTPRHLATESR